MIKLSPILLAFLLILTSCSNPIKTRNESLLSNSEKIESSYPKDSLLFEQACKFVNYILNNDSRIHVYSPNDIFPNHLKIFSKLGLESITAFSRKSYPKSIEPYDYEHFVLFILDYKNAYDADKAFTKLCTDCKVSQDNIELFNSSDMDSIGFLILQSKPGGFIFQKENCIYSLVETCKETPIGGTWYDYEDLFISFLTEQNESVKAINADCGKMGYIEEIRTNQRTTNAHRPARGS